jgi:Protein of unknown function (DUF2812).
MGKVVFRPFWSYDVIKTEDWLNSMHAKGYALDKINFGARLFYFKEVEPAVYHYRIVYEKNSNGNLSSRFTDCGFELVCFAQNYLVVKNAADKPQIVPSYSGFLEKNRKLKYGIGIALLILACVAFVPFMLLMIIIVFAIITGNYSTDSTAAQSVSSNSQGFEVVIPYGLHPILILILALLLYSFLKLRITNKQLERLCGDKLNLAFSIPKEGLLSKAEERALIREKKMIRKTKIAWIYAPDKIEIWLEQMENKGYNLYRMSKLGNSFYFLKGEPRKVKYYVDYQSKANPQYFNLNMENGWKLIFTSLSRIQSNHVWSQVYTDEPPMFYSDKESKLKHAKRFALTYSLCFFPVCILYIFLLILIILLYNDHSVGYTAQVCRFIILISYSLMIIEFGFFALRTVLYYFRVKKSQEE